MSGPTGDVPHYWARGAADRLDGVTRHDGRSADQLRPEVEVSTGDQYDGERVERPVTPWS